MAAIGIMLGVNDARSNAGDETAAQFQTGLQSLITTVRGAASALTNIPILLIASYQLNQTVAD